MKEQFFPALRLGEFPDAHSALSSVGISGHLADLMVAGMDEGASDHVAYEASIAGVEASARTVLVLASSDSGTIDLCYGYLDLAADSEEGAALLAAAAVADDVVSGDIQVIPEFAIFPATSPRRVLQ
jgi:hypothetical protein